ncbi:MAG TPA: glutamate racemase [Tepidisphaeraceae bacterium]|jgi:glutamate racemase|nr:glutamate racemase [Tepidisphaeraceae bacterium]
MAPSSPIVVLDSGLGGLTVVRALRGALPGEQILYFGDTARLPYGNKTAATVTNFVHQIISYLLPQNPKHVVIACNTATALALPAIRCTFPTLPISGVIEPGARAAVAAAGAKQLPTIGIIATEATVRSRAYERAIGRRRQWARIVQQSAPLLVPIIEEGRSGNDPLVRLALKQYLTPLVRQGIDVLVLGCTHYPILKDTIAQLVGPQIRVIDSAEQCAQDVAQRLRARGLLRDAQDSSGQLASFVTDDPGRFKRLAGRFLGHEIDLPTWVSPDELYRERQGGPVPVSIPA